jgi:hypothetical protein
MVGTFCYADEKTQSEAAIGMPVIVARNLPFLGDKPCPTDSQRKILPRHSCRASAATKGINDAETIFSR